MTIEALSYDELLISKRPHPIHNEHDADRVREEIQGLLHTYPRTDGEEEYLSLLGHLLIAWEHGVYEATAVSGIDALRSMIEDNGLTQSALVGPVFASPQYCLRDSLREAKAYSQPHQEARLVFSHVTRGLCLVRRGLKVPGNVLRRFAVDGYPL